MPIGGLDDQMTFKPNILKISDLFILFVQKANKQLQLINFINTMQYKLRLVFLFKTTPFW